MSTKLYLSLDILLEDWPVRILKKWKLWQLLEWKLLESAEQTECCSSGSAQREVPELPAPQEAGAEGEPTGCFALSWKHSGNPFC